jgi:hypothetical protein
MTTFTCDSVPERLSATNYNIAILTDLGAVTAGGGYDWDDHLNLGVALCTQDEFELRFVGTDLSDQNLLRPGDAVRQLYDAYESDLGTGTLPASSLTRKQLNDITVLGPLQTPPAAGYYADGDAGYGRAHNFAQRLIKCARDYGDPSGTFQTNPYGKLWVAINGGYSGLAQTLREAITGTALPDILDRCVFFGCPAWNALQTENAWAYFCNNHYFTDAVTPGIFGDAQMLTIWPLMSAIFNNNEVAQQTLWDTMKTQGAMGVYVEATRVGSNSGSEDVPRAGESVLMQYWLKEAKRIGSWDPTNVNNLAGEGFQLYDNNNWPYAHSGTGLWDAVALNWPVAETNFSPSHWGSPTALDTQAEAIAAFDMSGYRTWLGDNWARYA